MQDNQELLERFRRGTVLFDGAMGSTLIAKGLQTGFPPEEWNRSRPGVIVEIHKSYLEAGAEVIETNTFGGTPGKLSSHGLGAVWEDLNSTGIRLAMEAIAEYEQKRVGPGAGSGESEKEFQRAERKYVAFSLGPTGKMLPPVGTDGEDEIESEYKEQISLTREPTDLLLIETIFDLREGILALKVAKAFSALPVAVTLTFTRKPGGFFTIMGDEASAAIGRLEAAGADIVGANCSVTSKEMVELARTLRKSTSLPILCQPNAGTPTLERGLPVYDQRADEFAEDALRLFEEGINAVGGCCGTTPEFIQEVSTRLQTWR